jgi:predicted transcriptional regulator
MNMDPKRNGRPAVALRPATNRLVEQIARDLDISKSEVVSRAVDAYVQWRLDDPDMRRKETRPAKEGS